MQLKDFITDAICANGLTHLSIAMTVRKDGVHQWTGCAQWDGFARDGIGCTHGHGNTPEEAIDSTIRLSRVKRAPVDVEPITMAA